MAYSIKIYGNGNPSYNVQKRTGKVTYIVVHYTANGKPTTTNAAKNNCIYFSGGNRSASAHFFIDNNDIWEFADPSKWSAWHVGDGGGKYGITNQNSIGIEVVQDGNAPFSSEEINKLSWLVKKLMSQFNVPASRVVRHYDASRKLCPWYYTPSGGGGDAAWKKLHQTITSSGGGAVTTSLRDKVLAKAKSQLGVRYWTMHCGPKGSSSEGFGCAMLAAWCFNQVLGTNYYGSCWNFWGDAIGAPMYNQGGGEFETTNNPQPGDLVLYFKPNVNLGYSTSASHTAIYIGDGKVIGAWGYGTPGTSYYMAGGSVRTTTVAAQSLGGVYRYIRCKRLEKNYTPPAETKIEGMFELQKTVKVCADSLSIRDKPSTKTGKVIDHYSKGGVIVLDGLVFGDDGYLWGTYIGQTSGKRRYVAMGTHEFVSV